MQRANHAVRDYSVYQPESKAILKRYFLKFSKNGKLHEDDAGLLDPDGGIDAQQDGGYYARWGEHADQNYGEHAGTHLGTTQVSS